MMGVSVISLCGLFFSFSTYTIASHINESIILKENTTSVYTQEAMDSLENTIDEEQTESHPI